MRACVRAYVPPNCFHTVYAMLKKKSQWIYCLNHGIMENYIHYLPAERMNCTGDILGIYLFNIFEMKFPLEINLFTICVSTLNNWLQWQICVLFKFFPSHSGLMLRSSLWLLLIFIFKRGRNKKKKVKSACFFCCEMWHKEPILYSNPILPSPHIHIFRLSIIWFFRWNLFDCARSIEYIIIRIHTHI